MAWCPAQPEVVDVTTGIGTVPGALAEVLVDALNKKISSKVLVFSQGNEEPMANLALTRSVLTDVVTDKGENYLVGQLGQQAVEVLVLQDVLTAYNQQALQFENMEFKAARTQIHDLVSGILTPKE